MNIDNLFPSKYIRASDLGAGARNLRISHVSTERMGDGSMKPVIHFSDSPKPLVLNRINASTLTDLYGADTDEWAGEAIALFATTTEFQGRTVDCIRLRAPVLAKPAPGRRAVAEAADSLDDEIPF